MRLLLVVALSAYYCAAELQQCSIGVQFDQEKLSIASVHHQIRVCGHSCVDVTRYFLSRIREFDQKLNSMISLNPEALERAAELDRYYQDNDDFFGSLHCVPMTVKDNIWITGEEREGGRV